MPLGPYDFPGVGVFLALPVWPPSRAVQPPARAFSACLIVLYIMLCIQVVLSAGIAPPALRMDRARREQLGPQTHARAHAHSPTLAHTLTGAHAHWDTRSLGPTHARGATRGATGLRRDLRRHRGAHMGPMLHRHGDDSPALRGGDPPAHPPSRTPADTRTASQSSQCNPSSVACGEGEGGRRRARAS